MSVKHAAEASSCCNCMPVCQLHITGRGAVIVPGHATAWHTAFCKGHACEGGVRPITLELVEHQDLLSFQSAALLPSGRRMQIRRSSVPSLGGQASAFFMTVRCTGSLLAVLTG